ncbi:hypothetical protein [Streptomyces formicae]|uniref:Uncharacterized protein n=1 Tax=Streptomyces formicae TaxID=1616117 RepID=A0ABY3WEK4_9ACTN|nr:hypothetical protein [Streptomyces formicae]UNM10984.1 hypothetical protein J4032_05135 [Streptomyces formicae]
MSSPGRREEDVRRMLDVPPPPVPADLLVRATDRGTRLLRRRRALRRAGWSLLVAAVVAFAVWASVAQPWVVPPAATTPEIVGW